MMTKTKNNAKLPEGKTCADCRYCSRCEGLGIFDRDLTIPAESEMCDWLPSRFAVMGGGNG